MPKQGDHVTGQTPQGLTITGKLANKAGRFTYIRGKSPGDISNSTWKVLTTTLRLTTLSTKPNT